MEVELGPQGQLARVTAIDSDRVFFELRNGNSGFMAQSALCCDVGDVLLLSGEGGNRSVTKVPAAAWPDERWVGVVKIRLPDVTIIESGGRFRTVPTTDEPPYEEGNTVHATDAHGVARVLSTRPLRYIDLPAVDDKIINGFRVQHESNGLDFDAFGGLPSVVVRARELIEIPLKHHETLATIGARPIKGVLFTGAPGTGKTMLARIIASQADAAFYEISGPEIFSKWYGQSEELLRKLFEAAQGQGNAIIFFDEIDSVAGQRGDESHEASKRVVAQLLTLMDGFESDTNVIVIAATNRPQDLDVALRRPGRFDWEIEFPALNEDDRLDILAKTASRHLTSGTLPHEDVAARTAGWSGAELTAIWAEAALLAVKDGRDAIWVEDYVGGFERVARHRERVGQERGAGR